MIATDFVNGSHYPTYDNYVKMRSHFCLGGCQGALCMERIDLLFERTDALVGLVKEFFMRQAALEEIKCHVNRRAQ